MDRLLRNAAAQGKLRNVQNLLLEGANINAQNRCRGTALSQACENGHAEVVVELLKETYNVDANSENAGGDTP
jgi:ankyrin repeat protein